MAQVGLRDFLFYVLPGSVLLLGLFAFLGIHTRSFLDDLGVASSLAGLLLSYLLGQCAYPAAYVVRGVMNRLPPLRELCGEESLHFIAAYASIATTKPTYFAVEVFRYRTLARFCSLMIVPLLVFCYATVVGSWGLEASTKIIIVSLTALTICGFLWRYSRYETRYRKAVWDAQCRLVTSGRDISGEAKQRGEGSAD